MSILDQKLENLKNIIQEMESVLIAYSGGIFSTLLLSVAQEVLSNDRVIAITVKSEIHSLRALKMACANAQRLGVKHLSLRTTVLTHEKFLKNDPQKCYYCKNLLFARLKSIAKEQGLHYVIDGVSAEDLKHPHPGMQASFELGIRHPLAEAELSEEEIRKIAKQRGLENWDEPVPQCLASRVPNGFFITPDTLRKIEDAEEILKDFGFRAPHVEAHKDLARIKLPPKEISKIFKKGNPLLISEAFKKIGFCYTTIDLLGLQSSEEKTTSLYDPDQS